jgi:hypothetical protein
MPSFWLPPDARGNGLTATRWAEIIVVSKGHADELLEAFRISGVAACAAPVQQPWKREPEFHVWVDPDRYAAAENVLLREMSKGRADGR